MQIVKGLLSIAVVAAMLPITVQAQVLFPVEVSPVSGCNLNQDLTRNIFCYDALENQPAIKTSEELSDSLTPVSALDNLEPQTGEDLLVEEAPEPESYLEGILFNLEQY